ncbi:MULTISPECIES: BsuPI-related putative proteinase inhibitor [Saliphagus]|uniref:Intracellular proteinase inhibitor BsuPI domain-containing protein n=1 Tax=Saliphagus infecundisoli TaxID=1849069 RepID=A0ABD5QA54_9EURY|nr:MULTISPECIES: BsuPI-related putative proteinase inhibitor [Saliphagus]
MALDADLEVESGDPVALTLTVTNTGDEPREVTFRSGLEADFSISRDGEECWRWSDGRLFTQALRTETFVPGESSTYTESWAPSEPGTYTVVAALNTMEADVEERAEFVV